MTQASPLPHQDIECVCSGCKESHGRCQTEFGCFSSIKQKHGSIIVSTGCIGNSAHYKLICENQVLPTICCKEHLCNWNVTPSFPPMMQSSKCYMKFCALRYTFIHV